MGLSLTEDALSLTEIAPSLADGALRLTEIAFSLTGVALPLTEGTTQVEGTPSGTRNRAISGT